MSRKTNRDDLHADVDVREASAILPRVSRSKRQLLCLLSALVALTALASTAANRVVYIPYSDAKLILEAMEEALPAELRGVASEKRESVWAEWVKTRDAQIRERLTRGDEDTLVNFLLFGTSFTRVARLTSAQPRALEQESKAGAQREGAASFRELLETRIQDLIKGIAAPGNNERLIFAGQVVQRAGIDISTAAGRARAQTYLYESIHRNIKEQNSYQERLAEAAKLNDPTEEFAERSKLYRERGLSLDTSLPPDYALEVALAAMRDQKLLARGSVRRVGIIGPGLDFTDKHEGYDFYPTQTLQPFAVLDSLLRMGLARADGIEMDTLDLSARVNEHVRRARAAAAAGRAYTLQVPRDPEWKWKPELAAYWERFGDQIGERVKPVAVPAALRSIELRATRVRPEIVRRLRPLDVDIVLQRELAPEDAKFDLLIATNILVYYDAFEQSLALANIAAMLRPGGYLLTNSLLLELPGSKMKAGDYVSVEYSDRRADGDRILWYRREN